MNTPFEHENTPFGSFGEFEPVPADVDWDEHNAEAEAYFSDEADAAAEAAWYEYQADFYDYEPSPYDGTYSEM